MRGESGSGLPEIFCDLNASTPVGYRLTNGSFADLARLGLEPKQAVGMRFQFNGGDDTDESGHPADIMFTGTIVEDAEWGFLGVEDDNGVFWRRK